MRIPEHIFDRLPEVVRNDPRKSAVLAALLLVGAVIGLRMVLKSEPASAIAAVVRAESSNDAVNKNSRSIMSTLEPRLADVEAWIDQPSRPINRDIFAIRTEGFAVRRSPSASEPVVVDRGETSFWKRLDKSLALRADQKKQRLERLNRLVRMCELFKVQSTIMGQQPTAIVSGRMVRRGDRLLTADPEVIVVVERVDSRSVLVRVDEVMIELPLGEGSPKVK